MGDSTLFSRLQLAAWRQFESLDIEFHPQLTILTGANGSGKSTILNILSRHLGVERNYLSVPEIDEGGIVHYWSGVAANISRRVLDFVGLSKRSENQVGRLQYTNSQSAELVIPQSIGSVEYSLEVRNQVDVKGFHVPSHRLLPRYRPLPDTISVRGVDPNDAFSYFINESYARYRGDNTDSSLLFQLKNILTSWKIVGEGNSTVRASPRQQKAFDGFVATLSKILPPEIGFRRLVIQHPDVLLDTDSGRFLIDAASGGLATIIEIAAIIYACSIRSDLTGARPFVVTFDEPENHLHPSLQRMLLPALVKSFPQVQFVVATHSPFMVSSMKESNVYVLRHTSSDDKQSSPPLRDASRKIQSIRLDYKNRAGTAAEVLRDVLGVPVTLPTWVESDLAQVVSSFEGSPLNSATLSQLKARLTEEGLDSLFSEALVLLGERYK